MDQNWYTLVHIWLGNKQGNFQLHGFTVSENIARRFFWGELLYLTHIVCIFVYYVIRMFPNVT